MHNVNCSCQIIVLMLRHIDYLKLWDPGDIKELVTYTVLPKTTLFLQNYWINRGSGSALWNWLSLPIRLFVTQDHRNGSSVFLHEVGESSMKKSIKAWFLEKKLLMRQDCPKNGTKLRFWGFGKNLIHFYVLFFLNTKVLMVFLLSTKMRIRGKSSSWVMAQKPLNQSQYRIL